MDFKALKNARNARQNTSKSCLSSRAVAEQSDLLRDNNDAATSDSSAPTIKSDIPPRAAELYREQGLYKDLAITYDIRERRDRGRGIYASESIRRGSTIFSTKPHVAVLSTSYLNEHCSSCFSPEAASSTLKRCTKCETILYCSSACQTADWKLHKYECSAITSWMKNAPDGLPPSEPVRCLGRLLWRYKKSGPDSVMWREIKAMTSHRTSHNAKSLESHTHLSHSLVRYLGAASPTDLEPFGLSSAADIVTLTSRFTTNAFALTTPSLTPVGVVISPLTALVNHSCNPNIAIVFPRAGSKMEEPVMKAVSLRKIEPGEEIFVSYIDTTQHREMRQKLLKETYNFDCGCDLCVDQFLDGPDPRETIWCLAGCGNACALPLNGATSCSKCGEKISERKANHLRELVNVGQEALDKANNLELSDPTAALRLTTNILQKLRSSSCTPTSHPYLALNRLHGSLLINSLANSYENIDEAIKTSASCVSALRALLPEGHPARCVALAELGKLLTVDEPESTARNENLSAFPPTGIARLRLAQETLVRALMELEIGFGRSGGEIAENVRQLTRDVDREISVWERAVANAQTNA